MGALEWVYCFCSLALAVVRVVCVYIRHSTRVQSGLFVGSLVFSVSRVVVVLSFIPPIEPNYSNIESNSSLIDVRYD